MDQVAPIIHVLPRFDEAGFPRGFRACYVRAPGCVVILAEQDKAAAMVYAAAQALAEEPDQTKN